MRFTTPKFYSLYNLLWYIPRPIVRYEAVRFGTELYTRVWLLGIVVGTYVDEIFDDYYCKS